mmetsp:Transcript_11664/g.17295  ORF Transcript_11664/g.17295 Transcript_11664/m.17295 type:complete len:85 (-) Transcript_11664:984-1238(-)
MKRTKRPNNDNTLIEKERKMKKKCRIPLEYQREWIEAQKNLNEKKYTKALEHYLRIQYACPNITEVTNQIKWIYEKIRGNVMED